MDNLIIGLIVVLALAYIGSKMFKQVGGTEPVVRVMVEAPDHDTCQKYVSEVVDVISDRGYSL